MKLQEAKQDFIQAWGSLGTSWGINKVMAQIHAVLIIAPNPMSTDDIMDALQISRGNANMNVRALIDWGIVHKHFVPGDRKEYFVAEKDVYKLSNQVTKERKKRELEPIINLFENIQHTEKEDSAEYQEFMKVTKDLSNFSNRASSLLDKFLKADEHWFLSIVKKIL